jgi:hypothetical protein
MITMDATPLAAWAGFLFRSHNLWLTCRNRGGKRTP